MTTIDNIPLPGMPGTDGASAEQANTQKPCDTCAGFGCAECVPDTSPAAVVRSAIDKLGFGTGVDSYLAELLQILSDEMSDEHAVEREFPNHIPAARWQVCEFYGQGSDHDRWTAVLALARVILGQPDPNAAGDVA